jgi:crotonobetainyl-CoA:carnitine CoA-transferase CaiB-like acyl-CoA transferase
VLGLPELVDSYPSNRERVAARGELVPVLEARFRERPTAEWMRELWEAGVPSGPVNTVDRILGDPQVLHRGMVVGDGVRKLLGNPIKTGMPDRFRPAPTLGEHNDEVLGAHAK